MIELIFVIVVMGILAKFGVEFLARAYESFIFSSTNNHLQSKSATAVEFVANRLQYRIKDSVVVRANEAANITALSSVTPGAKYLVLEWIAADIDGFRGNSVPFWSGIIDLDVGVDTGASAYLQSPATDTSLASGLISKLAHASGTTINDAALYFIGSDTNINGFGWDGAITDQTAVMHPINSDVNTSLFVANGGTFAGTVIHEYYKLAWTANAIVIKEDTVNDKHTLWFHYDYQPWNGDRFDDATTKRSVLMEDVSTFQAMAIGSIIKIQVCTKSDLVEEYSLCKEKTIY
jgi:hypothetical protein